MILIWLTILNIIIQHNNNYNNNNINWDVNKYW